METKPKSKKYYHDGYKRETRDFLENYGHYPITALNVIVMPLPFILPIILNLLTRREFNKYMEEKGYERFYHWELMATIKIPNNVTGENEEKEVIIQKSGGEDIDINFEKKSYTYYYKSLISDKKVFPVTLFQSTTKEKKELTISEMLNKTRENMDYDEYYKWDMIGPMNCQGYVKAILKCMNLYDETVLSVYDQSALGDLEREFMQKHSISLFIIHILSYIMIYAYSFMNYATKCFYLHLLPRFSKYMNC